MYIWLPNQGGHLNGYPVRSPRRRLSDACLLDIGANIEAVHDFGARPMERKTKHGLETDVRPAVNAVRNLGVGTTET